MEGGKLKAESFINHSLVQLNHLLLQQLTQILVWQQNGLPKNGRQQKYVDKKFVEAPSKIAIFFPCKTQWFQICYLVRVNSPVWFLRLPFEVFWTKTKTQLTWTISVSCKRNIKSNDFEPVLSRQTCQRSYVLNHASGNGLCTKQFPTSFAPSWYIKI